MDLNIEGIGRIVLIAVGAVLVIWAFKWVTKGSDWKRCFAVIVALAPIGLGTFGLPFLPAFTDLLAALIRSPGQESYQQFLSEVAEGNVPETYRQLGLAFMLEHPIPEVGTILDQAIEKAPPADSGARQALIQAKDTYERKTATADAVKNELERSDQLKPETLEKFDRATRSLIAGSLLKQSDQELERLMLNRSRLKSLQIPQ